MSEFAELSAKVEALHRQFRRTVIQTYWLQALAVAASVIVLWSAIDSALSRQTTLAVFFAMCALANAATFVWNGKVRRDARAWHDRLLRAVEDRLR